MASPTTQALIAPPPHQGTISLPSSPMTNSTPHYSRQASSTRSGRGLGATPLPSTSYNPSAFSPPIQARPSLSATPTRSSLSTSTPLVPQTSQRPPVVQHTMQPQTMQPQTLTAPNYNITLPPAPTMSFAPMAPSMPASAPPLFAANMGGILAPSKPAQPSWSSNGTGKQLSKSDWGDFDPLA